MEVVANRKEPVAVVLRRPADPRAATGVAATTRMYHHTPPMTMLYALREGLRIVLEEGMEARIARHKRNAGALAAGLEAIGLTLHAQEGYRLPPLTTVRVPEGIDEMKLRQAMLANHNIEVGGGIGALQGQILRIGLMGYGSTRAERAAAALRAGDGAGEPGLQAREGRRRVGGGAVLRRESGYE